MKNAWGFGRSAFLMISLFLASNILVGCGGGGGGNPGGGSSTSFYRDADGDGYGNPADAQTTTSQPDGYVADNTDCNDTNAAIHPAATEVADGVDNNCNGQVDEGVGGATTYYRDVDGDGYGNPADSQTATSQPSGYVTDNTDCDDTNAAINPAATEVADGMDNNCNGQVDEGASAGLTLNLAYQPKTFHFTWADAADETEYRLLENPDGVSGFSQVATIVANTTSYDLSVFLPSRINAQYQLQACNSGGCTDSNVVTVDAAQIVNAAVYFKASNTEPTQVSPTIVDRFGADIALSGDGNTMAIGAYGEGSAATGIDGNQANNSASDAGAVYVFVHNTGGWSQQAYVKASNTDAGDLFGVSVALSDDGNTLVVGAMDEDSTDTGINGTQADNSATAAGAVYVFTRDGSGDWSQQAYLKASNTGLVDRFGRDVALSNDGNTLAVGAYLEGSAATGVDGSQGDDLAGKNSGAVYVFTRNGSGIWNQQAYIKASNTEANDWFGYSLDLSGSGNTLIVGAYGEDSAATGIGGDQTDNTAMTSGAVYVFVRDGGGTWSQQEYIKASNTDAGDFFGEVVSVSDDGNTLVVGASYEASNSSGINANQADNSAALAGAVYVFIRNGSGVWSQQAYIKAADTNSADFFGRSVALSGDGNMLSVGATGKDNSLALDVGAAYIFTRDGSGVWSQQAYIDKPNPDVGDFFGSSVALSTGGNILAVGADWEASSATGIGGDQTNNSSAGAGAVYLY